MKKIYILLFILSLVISCKKENFEITNLNGNKISKLGHAGMGVGDTYPMNSAESILKCLNLNMNGTEMDLQLTKDSVLVAFHDGDLNNKTNFSGKVNNYTWQELQDTRYIVTPNLSYKIIALDSLFSNIEGTKFTFAFDIKLYANSVNDAYLNCFKNALIALIEKFNLQENVFVESQSEQFLNLIQLEKPNYRLFIYPPSFEEGLSMALKNNYSGITISTRDVSKSQIQKAHLNGIQVAIWNTHTKKDNKDGILKNPDIIETDKVAYLAKTI